MLRKLNSLSSKSFLVGLILLIGLLGELCFSSHFVVCFVERRRKILIIFFGIVIMRALCGAFSSRSLVLVLLAFGVSKRRSRSSSSIYPLEIKGFFGASISKNFLINLLVTFYLDGPCFSKGVLVG